MENVLVAMSEIRVKPTGAIGSGVLGPSFSWTQWDMTHFVPRNFGDWAIGNGLYSKGSDYTSGNSDFRNPGQSALRKLWMGKPSDEHEKLSVWVIEQENIGPIGVIAWEIGEMEDKCCLGRVSMWMDPKMRKRGLIGQLFDEVVLPVIEQKRQDVICQGLTPYLRASDAAFQIVKRKTNMIVASQFSGKIDPRLKENERTHFKLYSNKRPR